VTEGRTWSPDDVQPGPLVWLQGWFASHCDGDWEHDRGITIETLDNPGWRIRIELGGTEQQAVPFDKVEVHRAEHDWCIAWVDGTGFEAACGPLNLGEVIHAFRAWCQR
jgi:Immunity protein 53